MAEFVGWLNDNAGALTLVFIVLTFLTLLETREARIAGSGTAHVAFRPDIDRSAGTTLRLRLRNHGPAVGEDVRMRMQWFEGGEARSPLREMTEPVLGVGDERVYVPDMLLVDRVRSLADMGGLLLRVDWSWLDERRRLLWPWARVRTRKTLDLHAASFAASVHGGPLILERDSLAEEVREVAQQVQKINDRATREEMKHWKIPDPAARAWGEHHAVTSWLRFQGELWAARWKVWTRRRPG